MRHCLLLCLLTLSAVAVESDHQTYAPMIESVAPTVVTVYTSREAHLRQRQAGGPQEDDPMWRFFFGDPRGRRQQGGGAIPETPRQLGQGSGVIVAGDGLVLTNNHVVEGADRIEVQLRGERVRIPATLVGNDPKTDIAVLRIDPAGRTLRPIAFADSDQARVGDLVFAIGNPFGVGHSVSMGIISATGRGDVGIADYEDFIQTDASINPGNSGGALVDSLGRLVGINTAIYSRTGGNVGIGFAVPSNLARQVMRQITAGGRVVRGYLGVQIGELTPELARKFKVPGAAGALVSDVVADSPAAKAGIQSGDVIVRIDEVAVTDPKQMRLHVAGIAPGSKVVVEVIRDGSEQKLELTVGELRDGQLASADPEGAAAGARLGLTLHDLDAEARQEAGVPARIEGALIADVTEGSRAERAGLRPGMILTEVERRPVADASAAVQQLKLAKGEILLRVWTQGGLRWVVVPE